MTMGRLERTLRSLVMGTLLEPVARFVWKKVLRRETPNDRYDRLTVIIMERALHADANCVDVGCHKGDMLEHMLRVAPRGKHYAYEPIPKLFEQLQRQNGGRANVALSDLALSNTAGRSAFHLNRTHPGYSGMKRREYPSAKDRVEVIEVRTDRLDDVIPVEQRVDFVKLDVEGAEYLVLDGAREHLRRYAPLVVFEFGLESCRAYDTGPEDMFDLLASCGLKVSLLEDYLGGAPSLSRDQFLHQVHAGINYYFLAHPPRQ